jgi:putative transposase
MKSKFSEEQIAYALREVESGRPPADVCRQLGVSEATFYIWKKKYAHLGVSELRQLRSLEDENGRLKRLVADLSLDKHILDRGPAKTSLRPVQRRELADWVFATFGVSRVRACELAQFSRTAWYCRSTRNDQAPLRARIRALAHPRLFRRQSSR